MKVQLDLDRRAQRSLKWYPAAWRERFGDEFVELLTSEYLEQPRSWRRGLNVVVTGMLARSSSVGLTGSMLTVEKQQQMSLAWLGVGSSAFLLFGAMMLSQLAIGWQWEHPYTGGESAAAVLMSVGLGLFTLTALLFFVVTVWPVVKFLVQRAHSRVRLTAGVVAVGLSSLVLGGIHFASYWPGAAGRRGAYTWLLLPRGFASFLWAESMSVTTEWFHPRWLHSLPTTQIIWMFTSPLLVILCIAGAVVVWRDVELAANTLATLIWFGRAAWAALGVMMVGAALWLLDGAQFPYHLPANLYHLGVVDSLSALAMLALLYLGARQLRRFSIRPVAP